MTFCYACRKRCIEIAGLCSRCERIRSALHSGVLDDVTRRAESAEAEATRVGNAWRTQQETLIDVLGEPARGLDDVAGMAANVIRTWRADHAAVLRDLTDAHDALDVADAPRTGRVADRIRALVASRPQGVPSADPVAVVALLDALDATVHPDASSVTHILRALRALVVTGRSS